MKKSTKLLLSAVALSGSIAVSPIVTHAKIAHANTISLKDKSLKDSSSGIWGTCPWNFNDAEGTLTIQSGTLGDQTLSPWAPSQLKINTNLIKKIVLEGKIFAPDDCNSLFGGETSDTSLPSLETIEGLENLDTSNTTEMDRMFDMDPSLKSMDLSSFDTSKVGDMFEMFDGDTSLENLDVSSFDTSNVTDMISMFQDDTSLKNLDVSSFDTSNVIDMTSMFQDDTSLKNLDVSSFNTSNVTRMGSMFSNTPGLSSLNLKKFDTSKVATMAQMFDGDTNLKSLDLSSFDTSNVVNMTNMFDGDTNLKSLDLRSFDTSKTTEKMDQMFKDSPNISQLVLGPSFKFGSNAMLAEPSSTTTTGKWQNVGTGTVENPTGVVEWTSAQLMSTYAGTPADTYVWQKKDGANITVKYIDDKGTSIAPNVVFSGKIGDNYSASQKNISGYTFVKVEGNAKGAFTDKAQTVTYVYKKNTTPPTPSVKYVTVYRLYNKNTGEHFYTESSFEKDSLVKGGWNNEGTGWAAPQNGTAVYRVYNPNAKGGDHYYTASNFEAQSLIKNGWKWDNGAKPVFYSGGKTPVYVAFNPNATASGSHNYTSSAFEQQSLLKNGWKFGKIQFYGK